MYQAHFLSLSPPSPLLKYAGRILEDSPLSLVLGKRSEKQGKYCDIVVEKSGEEKRGKKTA